MGFDAGDVVEPLDWTFVAITKDDRDQGTIPEPSDKAIDKLFKEVSRATSTAIRQAQASIPDDTPVEKVLEGIADLPDDQDFGLEEMLKTLNAAFSELCQGDPSAEQLARLPLRIRMRFFGWLLGELRPNLAGGVSMSPAPVNGQRPTPASRTTKPA